MHLIRDLPHILQRESINIFLKIIKRIGRLSLRLIPRGLCLCSVGKLRNKWTQSYPVLLTSQQETDSCDSYINHNLTRTTL